MPTLNARQQRFVLEYQVDQVATQAAIRAGYSAGTAHVQGSRLLSNVKVREAIAKAQAKAAGKAEVSVERVLKEYARIAFLNPQDLYDVDGCLLNVKDMPEDAARAIAGLEEEVIYGSDGEGRKLDVGRLKKIRLTGKIPALEGLARHLGMFQDERTPLQQAFQINIHVSREE
jgi:phage terminase small subunit